MATNRKWRRLLLSFIDRLRIVSREETPELGEEGIKLELWISQKRILDEITAGMDAGIRKFLILKSRQLGSSTICEVLVIFWLAMHPRMKGAIVVDQDKTREAFREQIRNIIGSIPPDYFGGRFGIKRNADNKYMMAFTNGSQIDWLVAGTGGSKVAWGESAGYSLVWLTEIASYGSEEGLNNFEEAMSGDNPDRLYIYESTAKGLGNLWHTRWQSGRADPYTARCVFVGWWAKEKNVIPRSDPRFLLHGMAAPSPREQEKIALVKERYGWAITQEQLAWRRWRDADPKQTESNLNQNQPWIEEEAFVLSGKSFFQNRLIAAEYERLSAKDENGHAAVGYRGYRFYLGNDFWNTAVEDLQGDGNRKHEIELRIWYPPVPGGKYAIGCDPAGGSDEKNDRNAITVWRGYADRLVQVAEYADNVADTRQAAWVLAYMAGLYSDCIINIELGGGYGKAVKVELDNLRQMLRSEIYQAKRTPPSEKFPKGVSLENFLDHARHHLYRRPDNPASGGFVTDFQTTNDSKSWIFSEFRSNHITGLLQINSRPLLDEMLSIVQDGDRISAPGRQKDDRTFAACLANKTWGDHIRPSALMLGETFAAVEAREASNRPASNAVDQIVQTYLRQVRAGVEDGPMSPAQQWMAERGLV
jgi:hypothetical protein